jgi:hypothetical protein
VEAKKADKVSRVPKVGVKVHTDVNADEGDLSADNTGVVTSNDTRNSNDELADYHAEGSPEEEWATTNFLHGVERDGGGEDVDDGGNHTNEEWIADGAELLIVLAVRLEGVCHGVHTSLKNVVPK